MQDDSPTVWIEQLAEGDDQAAQRLWEAYYRRLVGLVRQKLAASPRRVADEEDVVLSAFNSFCRRAAEGKFPELADRDGLWKLLMTITCRKAVAHLRHNHRRKRGGGVVRGESVFAGTDKSGSQGQNGIHQVAAPEPTPEFAAEVAEQCEVLLEQLDEGQLRQVAMMKLEGYSNKEIATELNCSVATIERKLARIRKKWEKKFDDAG